MHPKLLVTACIIVPLVAALVVLSLKVKERENDIQINLALLILGGSLGWLLGIFMSPYGADEKAAFTGYASAIATFVSGYLVGKIDPLVNKFFNPDFLFNKIVAYRVISFVSIALLAMLMTFAVREYLPKPENSESTNTLSNQGSTAISQPVAG